MYTDFTKRLGEGVKENIDKVYYFFSRKIKNDVFRQYYKNKGEEVLRKNAFIQALQITFTNDRYYKDNKYIDIANEFTKMFTDNNVKYYDTYEAMLLVIEYTIKFMIMEVKNDKEKRYIVYLK